MKRRPGRGLSGGLPHSAAGYVLRVEQRGAWRCYLLQDLRSGELHRFRLAAQLQQWLRRAGCGGLK